MVYLYPKILIVSHNCLSKGETNGRTIADLFTNWPKESLAQFYIRNAIPDSEVCNNYFRVTDVEALKALYKGIKVGRIIKSSERTEIEEDIQLNNLYKKHRKRTSLNYIARKFVWDSNRWKNKHFEKWIDDFNPDAVFVQMGDYSFMFRIALFIAKKRNIPLVIYNGEDYFFKDKTSLSPLYHYYRNDYKAQVLKLISYSSHVFYNSEMLQNKYQQKIQHDSTVIMTSTDIKPAENKKANSPLIVSYLGNLGVGRYESLIELANTINKIAPDVFLDVYGKIPNVEAEQALNSCKSIRLKGFVSYENVVKVMQVSDFLVHVENFSEFYQWDLKHAFSTKIADCLASGTCFLVYAPNSLAFTQYLMENDAACIVTQSEKLEPVIKGILENEDLRKKYIKNALCLAAKNHDKIKNSELFAEIMCRIVSEKNG